MSGEAKNTDTSGRSRPSDKGGPSHPDPEVRGGGAGLPKSFFGLFRPRFGLKIRGGPRPPGPSPRSSTGYIVIQFKMQIHMRNSTRKINFVLSPCQHRDNFFQCQFLCLL